MDDGDLSVEELFENAPCGFITARPDGPIIRVNATFLRWTGYAREDVVGAKRFQDLLTPGGRIFHETHYAPLLRMQGTVREIAVDIVDAEGRRRPMLVNSVLEGGVVRTTLLEATERKAYERELLAARDREREISRTLQRAISAIELPRDPRYEIDVLYRPADRHLEVGGDWYDAFRLPGERLGIVVGDVVGRGIGAASAMGQLRSAVRALAGAGMGPEAVMRHLDTFVGEIPAAQFATVVYAEVEPSAGAVVVACAGHLPPVVLGASPRLFEGGRSTPLGVPSAKLPRVQAGFTLAPGEGLVLYTDGLVERRRESIDSGLDRMLDAVARHPGARPETLAQELLEPGQVEDDVCVLTLRRPDPSPRRPRSFRRAGHAPSPLGVPGC